MEKRYYTSIDLARLICVICLAVATYGVPITLISYIQPLFHFATATLFTLYGYLVLRDDVNFVPHIRHSLIMTAILTAVYFGLSVAYEAVYHRFTGQGSLFSFVNGKFIFEYLVMNCWNAPIGSPIWLVQSTLYALVIFWALRKWKKYDWVLCIVLFVIGIAVGEGAGLFRFYVGGYTYISGNFLTRTMPYMLLGRLIHRFRSRLDPVHPLIWLAVFMGGGILCLTELYVLAGAGLLVYYNHLIGFIPMAIAVCAVAMEAPDFIENSFFGSFARPMYRWLYFLQSPVADFAVIGCALISKTEDDYALLTSFIGLFTIAVGCIVGAIGALIRMQVDRARSRGEQNDEAHWADEADER